LTPAGGTAPPCPFSYRETTMKSTYYVLDDHTLGYVGPTVLPGYFAVLQGDPFKGGHDWKNGAIPMPPLSSLRAATLADFDRFRVSPVGHIPLETEADQTSEGASQ
jgi:hypothetical protein